MPLNSRWTLVFLVLALVGVSDSATAQGFSIAEPTNMQVVRPGQAIPARVELGTEVGVRRVEFYWYRQGEPPLPLQQATPALIALATSEPPFGGLLRVPEDAIGIMRLLAVGEVAGGRLAGRKDFDEILVRAEPAAELLEIEFETRKPWRLHTVGRILRTPVVGQFADGVLRALGGESAGSTYHSSDPQVLSVYPNGLLRVVGNGQASLTVTNRKKTGTLQIIVRGYSDEPNEWPFADAGPDVTVKAGQPVALDGIGSMDPDGDLLQYLWTQVRGMKVSLLDFDTPRARFVAPKVSSRRLLRFELTVTDKAGPDTIKGADSLPSAVDIWVQP